MPVTMKPDMPYAKPLNSYGTVIALINGRWVDAVCVCKALHMTFSQVKEAFDVRVKPESTALLHPGISDHMLRLKPRSED